VGQRRCVRCMGCCRRNARDGAGGGPRFRCMGFRRQHDRVPPSLPGRSDGELPWCKGFCLRLQHSAVLRPAQPAGWPGRRQQFWDHAFQPGGELRRQPVGVADRVDYHSRAPGQGEDTAIQGAGLGAVVPVDGAGRAQSGQAFLGARAGAAAAMHAAAEFSPDGRSTAGAAGAGAGATARREPEVGIAAALWGGFRNRGGWRCGVGRGHECGPGYRVSSLFLYNGCSVADTAICGCEEPVTPRRCPQREA
jgi:hypothetical protein